MAYCRNRGPSKVDPCVALCNTFNSLCFKKASKNCFYEDYVLLRNQLLLLEYDEDDPTVPSKLYEIADLLRRYIEDVPKPIQETIEFVKDIHRKIFFLYGIASRDLRDNRKFPKSQELHLLLVRYVELEYEALYSPENYSPEYQKQVEKRVLSLLLTIFKDSKRWQRRAKLEGNTEEICAMNTLHIMTRVRVEYKKPQNFIENIMIKLLRILNVLDKVSEMKNKNRTFQVDKLLQVPKVQKIFEYLQSRDYGLEDPNTSEDEIEEVVEVAVPVKNEEVTYEVEEKYDISSFACCGTQKKVMTIDLIDEDFSMVYFRPEVQKLDNKDKKRVFDSYNVQISERTLSNISDRFDKYIQLNSVTTSSTTCDNKLLNSKHTICQDSVFLIDDDSDSDVEILQDRSCSIVNLENDSIASPELINNKQQSPYVEVSKHLQSATNSLELEDALLQCDDISDNEIENEDEILNKYHDDADDAVSVANVNDVQCAAVPETSFPLSTVVSDKPEVTITTKRSTTSDAKAHDHQDNSPKDNTICTNSDSEKEFQNNDLVINNIRKIDNKSHAYEINSISSFKSKGFKKPTVSHMNPPHTVENQKDENVDVPINTSNLNKISSNIDITPITSKLHVLPQTNNSVVDEYANQVTKEGIADHRSAEINEQTKEAHFNVAKKSSSLVEAKVPDQVFESSAQTVSVTTANSSFVVATEESFINSTTKKIKLNNAGYNSTNAITQEYVKDAVVLQEEISAEVNEGNQVSPEHKTNNEDDVLADRKLVSEININTPSEIVQNEEEIDVPCIVSTTSEDLSPAEDNKVNQELQEKRTIKNESLQCSNTKSSNSEITTITAVSENECVTSPVSYENQTSCEDIEEYVGEFNAAFPDHTCSNNLDVLASVAAEQEKMENSIEMRRRGKKKKGRRVIKANKNSEKSKKKIRKSELTETKNHKQIGVVTRRVTRSSSAQLNYSKEPQGHLKCIPSTFMNLENLVTPTPNRVYNLIPETVIDNEESLDEPLCLVSCENQQTSIGGQFVEIVAKNPVFDEDTIEDGIALVCHTKQQSNNKEVVISIPDTEKDFPGINFDILEQAEQFAETNSCVTKENTHDEARSEGFYQSSQIATRSDVLPKDDCKNKIWEEVIVEPSTKIAEYQMEEIIENDNVAVERFDGKEITLCEPLAPLTASEKGSFNSNKLLHSALEIQTNTDGLDTDTKTVSVIPNNVSHEIIINETEETVSATPDTETFNHFEHTVNEVKSCSTPSDKTDATTNFTPKKNKRKASLNKTAALIMPVKKRQNYGKKNIIINKYEKKNETEMEDVVGDKNIGVNILKQQDALMDKTININKHIEQTKDVSVLDHPSSKKPEDGGHGCLNVISSSVTDENVDSEKTVDSESTIQVCGNADANQNHVIEENCEIIISADDINNSGKTEIPPNNKENTPNLQRDPETQQEEVNRSAEVELAEEEINSVTVDSVIQAPAFTVEEEVGSCETKSTSVISVTKPAEFTTEEKINSSENKSAMVNCVTETPEFATEEVVKTKSATVDCVTETPEFTTEEVIQTKSATVDCVTKTPEFATEEVIQTKSATVDCVTETPEFATEEVIKTKSATADCVTETPEFATEEVSKTKSATVDCIMETPEFATEEVIQTKSATADCVTETPEFATEEVIKTKSATVDCVTETPEFATEGVIQTKSATVECVTEIPEFATAEIIQTKSATVDSVTEVPEFTIEKVIEIKSATGNCVTEAPELVVQEEINSSKNKSATGDYVTEAPEFTVEEEISSCETKSAETGDCVTEPPELIVETTVNEMAPLVKSMQCNNNIEMEQLQAELIMSKDEETVDNYFKLGREEETQTCENEEDEKNTEVPIPHILNEELVYETVVSTEKETKSDIESTAELLVEGDKTCHEGNNISQIPPVLEKATESHEIGDSDNSKESLAADDCEFENNQNTRIMPTLEREISLNQIVSKPSEDTNIQKEDFVDDSYPLLAAYEIEAVTEEVVESWSGDIEPHKLFQSQVSEENVSLETSSEKLVGIPKEPEITTDKEVIENTTDPSLEEQTKETTELDSKNAKIVTNSNNSEIAANDHRVGNGRVLTKAALKAFQNPYVQLQKLPDNYDYKRKLSELAENPKAAKIGEQRSKSQDNTAKRHKRDTRSLSESKHKKRHENLEKSESSKREKRVKQKDRESHSKKNNLKYFSERDENKNKDNKEETFKTKTRSSSQKQRNKEAKLAEKPKTVHSLPECKIELKSKQTEEKKSSQKEKHRIGKELQLFSVEDSKITYYEKKKKRERETVKRDTVDTKSTKKEEKSSQLITDNNEEIGNNKSPTKDSTPRSSSRNGRKSSKQTRDKSEKEEIETHNKHGVGSAVDDANQNKIESSYSARRHSRRSMSLSRSTENIKDDKSKKTSLDLKDSKEKSKKNENSNYDKMTNSDSDKLKTDKIIEDCDKNVEVFTDVKKSADHKRHRSSRSSSKNSEIAKFDNKDSEDTVHEKKKPRIVKNKENVCLAKSESEYTKKHANKKSASPDIIEKKLNDLEPKVIDTENVEPKVLKRERRGSLRSSSTREKSKSKSSLKENGSLSETDMAFPLDLSEKPKDKLLKENKKLPKKRRLSEDHTCAIEVNSCKKSTNKKFILEENQLQTTVVSELIIQMDEIENRETIPDKQSKDIVINMQTEEPFENKNHKTEYYEKFNCARKYVDQNDCETVANPKNTETSADKLIEASSKKKEPKKNVSNSKELELLENCSANQPEKIENLTQSEDTLKKKEKQSKAKAKNVELVENCGSADADKIGNLIQNKKSMSEESGEQKEKESNISINNVELLENCSSTDAEKIENLIQNQDLNTENLKKKGKESKKNVELLKNCSIEKIENLITYQQPKNENLKKRGKEPRKNAELLENCSSTDPEKYESQIQNQEPTSENLKKKKKESKKNVEILENCSSTAPEKIENLIQNQEPKSKNLKKKENVELLENCSSTGVEKIENLIQHQESKSENLKKKEKEPKKNVELVENSSSTSVEKIENLIHNQESKSENLQKKEKESKKNVELLENSSSISVEKIENLIQNQEPKSETLKESKKNVELLENCNSIDAEKIENLIHNQRPESENLKVKEKESKKNMDVLENCSSTDVENIENLIENQELKSNNSKKKEKESKKRVDNAKENSSSIGAEKIENLIQNQEPKSKKKKEKEPKKNENSSSTDAEKIENLIQNQELKSVNIKKKESKKNVEILENSSSTDVEKTENLIQNQELKSKKKKEKEPKKNENSSSTDADKIENLIQNQELKSVNIKKKESKKNVEILENSSSTDVEKMENLIQNQEPKSKKKKEKEPKKNENSSSTDAEKIENLIQNQELKSVNIKKKESKKNVEILENSSSTDVEKMENLIQNQELKSKKKKEKDPKKQLLENSISIDAEKIENLIQSEEPRREESKKKEKVYKKSMVNTKNFELLENGSLTDAKKIENRIQNQQSKSEDSTGNCQTVDDSNDEKPLVVDASSKEYQACMKNPELEIQDTEDVSSKMVIDTNNSELSVNNCLIDTSGKKNEVYKEKHANSGSVTIMNEVATLTKTDDVSDSSSNNHEKIDETPEDEGKNHHEIMVDTDTRNSLINDNLVGTSSKKKEKLLESKNEGLVNCDVVMDIKSTETLANQNSPSEKLISKDKKSKSKNSELAINKINADEKSNTSIGSKKSEKAERLESKKKDPKRIDFIIENLKNRKCQNKKEVTELAQTEHVLDSINETKEERVNKNTVKCDSNMEISTSTQEFSGKEHALPSGDVNNAEGIDFPIPTDDEHEHMDHSGNIPHSSEIINETATSKEFNDSEQEVESASCSINKTNEDLPQPMQEVECAIIPSSVSEINNHLEEDHLVEKEDLSSLVTNAKEPEIPSDKTQVAEFNAEKAVTDTTFVEKASYEVLEPENFASDQSSVEKFRDSCFDKIEGSLPELTFPTKDNSVQETAVDESSLHNEQTSESESHMIVDNNLTENTTDVEEIEDDSQLMDIRPHTPESAELINDDSLIEIPNSESDVTFIEKPKAAPLANDLLHFKHHTERIANNKHYNKNDNCMNNIVPMKNNAVVHDHSVPSTSAHSINNFTVSGVSQVVVPTSVPLLDVDKRHSEEVIVNLSTSNAEASTSCETTDNLIAVIFSNVALCNNTEVINDSERNQPNKTGFIYFRGTDHNYHSVGDPLLSGKCDNNESDHSSENSKEVPTAELENVLVDDNILPYIPTLTENNLNQELSSSLSESPVDSSTDFQLLEQCLIENTLGRESSPPLPQGCDNLYQTNLKQEVLDYDDNSTSSNMEFTKESSEVYINQFQQQTMSVENMSELMNAVLTRIQNLNNMTRPTQRYDSTKENLFQPVAAEFNVSADAIQTTNTNSYMMPQNLESDCNFVPIQEIPNSYTHPETNVEYSNISFGNEVPEPMSFETDFTNFYYLPVAHDTSLNNNCNKKVIVERIPQYSEQQLKSFTEINNVPSASTICTSTATNRPTSNVIAKPTSSIKQPEIRSSNKAPTEITTSIKPSNLLTDKIKQNDINSDPVPASTTINVGFVRTSSRTRVSAPRPKKPSDRKSVDTRESEESGTEADRICGNKSDNRVLKLKVRADLGISSNCSIDISQGHKIVPAKERSLCIIEDSNGLGTNKHTRLSVEENSSSKLDGRKSSSKHPKERDTVSVEDFSKFSTKTQHKQPKEDVISVEDLNKLNPRRHSSSSSSKPQKQTDGSTDKPLTVKTQTVELTKENSYSVKDAKSQTTDLIINSNIQTKAVDKHAESSHSDMIDNVKRRKRKPVDYIERVDYSSIDKLLGYQLLENAKLSQRSRQKKEDTEDVSPRPKKRKQEIIEDKQLKSKTTCKPLQETERTKVDAVAACNLSDTDPDVVVKPTTSIFEDSDDDIPLKKKSKPESRLEPDSMNDLFDRLVKEGNINTIKNTNVPKPNKGATDPSSAVNNDVQKFNKNVLDARAISSNIFNLEHKKSDAITPVKQIGVVNPIPRSSNVVRKEPPCNRNSYGGSEESRNSSQYYPYYSDRSRRSYPYSNRESSSRSSHQGSSRRMEYQPHSSDQRYSSSQRQSSSGRSSRSSRHHSNSRSSTEQRNYNRYTSSAATDLAWREDMKKKFPNMFKDEVYF